MITETEVATSGKAMIGKTRTELVKNAMTDNVTVSPSIPVSPCRIWPAER